MKKITLLLLMVQCGFLFAQTKTVVTPNGEKIALNPLVNNGLTAENGYMQLGGTLIQPTTVQTGSANTLALSGLPNSTDTNDAPVVVSGDGTLKKGAFPVVNIVPSDVGTVIAVGGKLEVAQEITAHMGADFIKTAGSGITPIGNISNVIIDNKSRFTTSSTTNSFTVDTNGIYLIILNVQASTTSNNVTENQAIVVGLADNATGKWVARVSDAYVTANGLQTYTLVSSVPLVTGRTYSFAVSGNFVVTVYALNSGGTGSGPVSFYSCKRLK